MSRLMNLYHALPAPFRDLAASARGLYLRRWRYGPETERLVVEALERERWSAEQWKTWQENQLERVLERAVTRVPYYRTQWAERQRQGDKASWHYLENWPVLEKAPLRQNPRAFLADDCDPRQMFAEHTSGTSGTPLDLWWSKATVRGWYALSEARIRRWSGVSRHEPWAILGGQQVVPARVQSPPFWVWNAAMHQLYLSSNHLSRRHAPAYMRALRDYGITHMIAYTSSASLLSADADHLGLPPADLKLVATNAEPLFPWQRSSLQKMLSPNTRETYGMAEIAAAASECEHGQLHVWPEVGWLEVIGDSGEPLASGGVGRLLCTGLLNVDMPLVRYAVGDRTAGITGERCACGRTLPVLAPLEGRVNDLLLAPDGRRVFWVNPVLYGQPIIEAQIVQETRTLIRVLYIPAPDFTDANARTIVERLQGQLGAVEVEMVRVDSIPRSASGKFKAVVCKLSTDEIARVEAQP